MSHDDHSSDEYNAPDQGDPRDDAAASPFEGIFKDDGSLDPDVAGRRLPALVDILRHEESCFDLRIDFDALADALVSPAGVGLRDAGDEEDFESALRAFSRDRLHELVGPDRPEEAGRVLQEIADDEGRKRKQRRAAAVGVALLGGLPDDSGLRGRGLFDLVLRISLEELHAQEGLRRRANEEGGLEPDELQTFWETYPALRHHYEKRYRLDVQSVLDALEQDVLPHVVSLDLALRGVHRMLSEVAARGDSGGAIDSDAARALLHTSYEDDMLDDGRELIVARWAAAAQAAREGPTKADAARAEACERAVRIAGPGSPGGEMVLFNAYMRAVVEGSFHVRDDDEAAAARALFADVGLSVDGVLAYEDYLRSQADDEAARRVLRAGIELWPEHAEMSARAVAQARAEEEAARADPQGPLYAEVGETFAEVPAEELPDSETSVDGADGADDEPGA